MSAKETTPWIGEAKLSKDDYRVEAVADGKQLKVVVLHKEEEKLRVELAQSLLDAKRKEGGRPINAQAMQALLVLLIQTFAPSASLDSEVHGRVVSEQEQLTILFIREMATLWEQENKPAPESFARLFVQAIGDERAVLFVTLSREQITETVGRLAEEAEPTLKPFTMMMDPRYAYWNDVYSEIKKIVLPPVPS